MAFRPWSLSSLGTHEQCGLKYKFKYIDRVPEKRTSLAASRGIDMHKEIEEFLLGQRTSLTGALSFYNVFLEGLKKYPIFTEHKITVTKEWKPTTWDAEDAWHRSVLDLKLVAPKFIAVYDWKSGKMYPEHMDQKELYAIDVLSEHPEMETIKATHVYLDLNKHTERTYFREELIHYRERWERKVANMHADVALIANPSWRCRSCGYSKNNGGTCQF